MLVNENNGSFLVFWQFYQDMANSEKALRCIHEILKIDERFAYDPLLSYMIRLILYQ